MPGANHAYLQMQIKIDNEDIAHDLSRCGIRPTANRILVLRALRLAASPMSMTDLERTVQTLDKSSIFRALTLLLEKGMVHALEDGRGIVRYEPCAHPDHAGGADDDRHVHFYCEVCHSVTCLNGVAIPAVQVPAGFRPTSVNYMIKGICPDCARNGAR